MSNSRQSPLIDVVWFARRCVSTFESVNLPISWKLSSLQKQINACSSTPDDKQQEEPFSPEVMDKLGNVAGEVFKQIGLNQIHWQDSPKQGQLPMLAILPGIGCGIIYSQPAQDQWLMETPDGSQQLYQLPENGRYAAMVAPFKIKKAPTALQMFKDALASQKVIFYQAAFTTLLVNTFALATSLYTMQVYDRVIPTQGLSTLIVLSCGVGMSILFELLLKHTRSIMLERSIKSVDLESSHKVFERLLNVRMDQFPASVGTLSAQMRSYETIRTFASSAVLYVLADGPFALLFVGVIYMLAGPALAIIPAVAFFIAILVGLFFSRRIAHHARTSSLASNLKLGLLVESVEAAESLKANCSGWQALNRWGQLSHQSIEDDLKLRRYNESASFLSASIQQFSYASLIATGAWIAATTNEITMGTLIACSILSGRILAPVVMFPGLVVQWANSRVALKNLEAVFSLENDNHGIDTPAVPEKYHGAYTLKDVRYAYPEMPDILTIPSLEIKPGEKIAVLGANGSGKSTLMKILSGLYKQTEGQVLLDGVEIQHISRHHMAESVGYLPQNIRLVSGTLRDNVLSGLHGIEEQKLLDTLKLTGLDSVIAGHPHGLDLTIAEGGSGISGGQKQLVVLTHLLLSLPSIWLLDEPTATMDNNVEQRCIHLLQQFVAPEHTLILVTHNPKLLCLVDRIIVLTQNGIVLDGPRDEVLTQLQNNPQNKKTAPAPGGGSGVSTPPGSSLSITKKAT